MSDSIGIFINALRIFARTLPLSIIYSVPAVLSCYFFASAVFVLDVPLKNTLLYGLLLLATHTLYIYSISKVMCKQPTGWIESLLWKKQHTDFLFFVNLGIVFLVLLMIVMYYLLPYVYDIYLHYDEKADKHYSTGLLSVNPFRMKAGFIQMLMGVLAIVGVMIWAHLCHTGLRIPAYASGRYMRTELAIDIIEQFKFITYFYSLACIAVAIFFFTLASVITAHAPVVLPFLVTISYFCLTHAHLAIWSSIYNIAADSHHIPKVVL